MVHINNATVTTADIMASNGVIHVIDKVILPPSMSAYTATNIVLHRCGALIFTTLATAVNLAGRRLVCNQELAAGDIASGASTSDLAPCPQHLGVLAADRVQADQQLA